MPVGRKGCPVATVLTVEEHRRLAEVEAGANQLEDFTWCELEPGTHEGDWHYAEGQAGNDGVWWLRWKAGVREIVRIPFCPAEDERPQGELLGGEREPCTLFEGHAGGHDFEYGLDANRSGLLHRALTVGDLRKALEGLDDSAAIRVGAVSDGVLPATGTEALLQAVADGAASRAEGALVLLIGLNTMAPGDRTG
ncbi:hypothetical protein [Streptomyces sp. NPDC051561]|uniref:hypothetical protein n=1 Tax=Streptomyces sp. NPDC051561 TaxID=3365658 RepID=UPI0037BA7EE2